MTRFLMDSGSHQTSSKVFLKLSHDTDNTDNDFNTPNDEVRYDAENPTPDPSPVSKSIRFVGNLVFNVWSYTTIFLGVVFSLGLVLNLFGFGYQFSREKGLRIETIEELRIERQFEQVSKQYCRKDDGRENYPHSPK